MTYGGIYREVRLEIRDECHVSDIFAMPEKTGRLTVQCQAEGSPDSVRHTVYLNGGKVCEASSESVETCALNVPDVILWDTENPALYTLVSELIRNGEITDRVETRIGFRGGIQSQAGSERNPERTARSVRHSGGRGGGGDSLRHGKGNHRRQYPHGLRTLPHFDSDGFRGACSRLHALLDGSQFIPDNHLHQGNQRPERPLFHGFPSFPEEQALQ